MDELEQWEAWELCQNIHHADKNARVVGRLIAYITAQVNSTKRLKASDILPLPWDTPDGAKTTISNEDIKRLKDKAATIKITSNGK